MDADPVVEITRLFLALAPWIIGLVLLATLLLTLALRVMRPRVNDDEMPSENGPNLKVGPPMTMSGPEFLKMIESQSKTNDVAGYHLHVKIPDPMMPIERGEKYEDPIDEILSAHDLGAVTGGGSVINRSKQIEYVSVDITVHNLDAAVDLVVQALRDAGAPRGTVIQFENGDRDVWSNEQHR